MVWKRTCRLGNTVSAAWMVQRSQDGLGTERSRCLKDACVIGGDNDFIDLAALLTALPDVLNQRFPGDEVERLTRKAGGAPAGRYGNKGAWDLRSGQGW